MSVDSARNKVLATQNTIAKLQREKSRQVTKISDLTKRASAASQAAVRSTSASTAASKMREHERYQKQIADTQKKLSSYEDRIAREQQKCANAQKELSREEDRVNRKKIREEEQRLKENQRRMQSMSRKLVKHDTLHRDTMNAIERLNQLPEKITVLFLASNPVDQPQLRLDAEARTITEMIRKSKHRDSVQLESCWAVQPLDVLQAINEHRPQVVHFSGHGSNLDEIVFQDKEGNAKTVSKDAIVQTMLAGSSDIQLVFFNTCFSHRQAEAVVKYVKAAVGMTVKISDEAARVFAAQFYSAVGFGHSIKNAFEQAKAALMLEGISEEDTPVLKTGDGIEPEDLVLVRPASEGSDTLSGYGN